MLDGVACAYLDDLQFAKAEDASDRAIVAELEAVNADARAPADQADVMETLRDTNLKARLGFAL
jgi:hypothetical protein